MEDEIMYLNGIRFVNTISHNIKFMIVEHIANTEFKAQNKFIWQVKCVYMNEDSKVLTLSWMANLSESAGTWPRSRSTLISAPTKNMLDILRVSIAQFKKNLQNL